MCLRVSQSYLYLPISVAAPASPSRPRTCPEQTPHQASPRPRVTQATHLRLFWDRLTTCRGWPRVRCVVGKGSERGVVACLSYYGLMSAPLVRQKGLLSVFCGPLVSVSRVWVQCRETANYVLTSDVLSLYEPPYKRFLHSVL